jgi:hypothetical protein
MERSTIIGKAPALAGLAIATLVQAQTLVGGPILDDTTWALADSPFRVASDVEVGNGATLTIEAGVVVQFDDGTALTIGPLDLGVATLIARGTPDAPIRFEPSAPLPDVGQWAGLQLLDLAVDATFEPATGAYLAGSILEYAAVSFAGGAPDPSDAAVLIHDSTPLIRNVEVTLSASDGVAAMLQPGQSITLERIEVRECQGIGICLEGGRGHALSDMATSNNRGGGLAIEDAPQASIDGFQSSFDDGAGAVDIQRSAAVVITDMTIEGASSNGVRVMDSPMLASTRLHATESALAGLSLQGDCTSARIDDSTFERNNRGMELLDLAGTAPHDTTIETTAFTENITSRNGGAIAIRGTDGVVIDRSVFVGNESDGVGGALVASDSAGLRITSGRFEGNASAESAGAMALMDGAHARVIDTVFDSNVTFEFGGAVFVDAGAGGIDLGFDPVTGAANRFRANVAGLGRDIYNGLPFNPDGSGDIDATCVEWGTSDPDEVRDRIWEFDDEPALGRVLILPLGPCPPACRADLDGDGRLTIFDFLTFFNLFDAGDLTADFDGDGWLTIFDFLSFQNAFSAGCG